MIPNRKNDAPFMMPLLNQLPQIRHSTPAPTSINASISEKMANLKSTTLHYSTEANCDLYMPVFMQSTK